MVVISICYNLTITIISLPDSSSDKTGSENSPGTVQYSFGGGTECYIDCNVMCPGWQFLVGFCMCPYKQVFKLSMLFLDLTSILLNIIAVGLSTEL